MLILKKIRWKNFLSTGNTFTEIILNKRKSTLISGANGSGKTTLLDALVFGLFGKPYRNINIPQLVNSVNKKDCIVEIEFSVGGIDYKVVRGLAPKTLEIYKQGKLIDQDSKAKDYQKMFEENILKMNCKAFCQVIVLGSTNYIPFMALTAGERREIVEALLDIDVFSMMNSLLKGKISENKEELKEVGHKLSLLKERADAQTNHIKVLKEKSKTSIEKYQQEIEQSLKQNEELNSEILSLTAQINDLVVNIKDDEPEIEKQLRLAERIVDDNDTNISKIEKEISFYHNTDKCPTCSQNINAELKTQKLHTCNLQKNELKDYTAKQVMVIDSLKEKLQTLFHIQSKIDSIQNKIKDVQSNISANNQYIKKMNKQIADLHSESGDIESENDKLQIIMNDGKKHLDDKKELEENAQYYTMASLIMKDSGIKSKIIKYYLPIMNKIINQYLDHMDFFVHFELDESFVETIKSRHRDIFTYASFSEGEKRKIDLALLFAWREIAKLKNSLNCNLLIFDEVLDGSLDDTATDAFLSIINSKFFKKDTNIFVISHKPKDTLQDKFKGHLTFVKKNNFSRLDIP